MSEEQFKFECEARFWANFAKKRGRIDWAQTKNRLIRRRGQAAVDRLVLEMERQRKNDYARRNVRKN